MRDTILVVDDEPILRELLIEFLQFHGFKTRDAEDAKLALKFLNEDPDIALVLSDALMPGINGFELCARSKDVHPEIPFIIVSGNCALYKSRKDETHVDGFIEKPFDYDEILTLVRQVLH
jgi:DNA-binding NtrC family response regulator